MSWPVARLAALDEWLCDVLKQNIRPLVSAGLIFGTLLGAVVLATFFTVQIGENLSDEQLVLQRNNCNPSEVGAASGWMAAVALQNYSITAWATAALD